MSLYQHISLLSEMHLISLPVPRGHSQVGGKSGLGLLEGQVLCNSTYVVEDETSPSLPILLQLRFLSKGMGRRIFRLQSTPKESQSLRPESGQSRC